MPDRTQTLSVEMTRPHIEILLVPDRSIKGPKATRGRREAQAKLRAALSQPEHQGDGWKQHAKALVESLGALPRVQAASGLGSSAVTLYEAERGPLVRWEDVLAAISGLPKPSVPQPRNIRTRIIGTELCAYPEVRWDRFIENGGKLKAYGWLDRDDGRSDFLLLDFDTATGDLTEWITSAHPHPASVVKRLESEASVECQRVEDRFDVPNAVRLGKHRPQPPAPVLSDEERERLEKIAHTIEAGHKLTLTDEDAAFLRNLASREHRGEEKWPYTCPECDHSITPHSWHARDCSRHQFNQPQPPTGEVERLREALEKIAGSSATDLGLSKAVATDPDEIEFVANAQQEIAREALKSPTSDSQGEGDGAKLLLNRAKEVLEQMRLREHLAWAIGWIEQVQDVPLPDEEAEARKAFDAAKAALSDPQGEPFAEIDFEDLERARQHPGIQALHQAADRHIETLQKEGRIDSQGDQERCTCDAASDSPSLRWHQPTCPLFRNPDDPAPTQVEGELGGAPHIKRCEDEIEESERRDASCTLDFLKPEGGDEEDWPETVYRVQVKNLSNPAAFHFGDEAGDIEAVAEGWRKAGAEVRRYIPATSQGEE